MFLTIIIYMATTPFLAEEASSSRVPAYPFIPLILATPLSLCSEVTGLRVLTLLSRHQCLLTSWGHAEEVRETIFT